ncbi:Transmembrane protein 62 [Kappamyces sp. JEL0680]|nr:Transmembrane protein 62 [Kappamyces sp. JEL0680]
MQITDLHVSIFTKHGGLAHLEAFLYNELPLVAPDLVLATGDLTDGKSSHFLTSLQQPDEWYDLHGNHDCWNVPSFQSPVNMFKDFSSIKKEGYSYVHKKPFGTYSFVALDGCPMTGAGRPLNFFGYLDTRDMDLLADVLERALREGHNHTFGMSHYPTGTTLFGKSSQGIGFWDMTQHVSVWLCGHLHKLAAGLGETMYAFQDNTVLELELGDMKSHGLFRVVAVDNDLISFVDLPIHQEGKASLPFPHASDYKVRTSRPPIVLVTNPKDGRYMTAKEPYYLIKNSTHIRAMVWSSTPTFETVVAYIDGEPVAEPASYRGYGSPWSNIANLDEKDPYVPLWTIPWTPAKYDDDQVHWLSVVAIDQQGRKGNHTVRFRVDGERIRKMESGPGGFIISLPLGLLFKDLFIVFYLLVGIGFLLLPKLFVLMTSSVGVYEDWKLSTSAMLVEIDRLAQIFERQVRPSFKVRVQHRWSDFKFTMVATFFRFCELSRISHLFYPLYLYSLYILVGPWFFGDFVPAEIAGPGKRWGWLMVYGIWLQDGTWEPILDTWLYAWYGLLYTLLPLVFYLSFCITPPRLLYSHTNPRLSNPIHSRSYIRVIVIGVLVYHAIDALTLSIFYGIVSTVLSPGRTWILIWAWYQLKNLGCFYRPPPLLRMSSAVDFPLESAHRVLRSQGKLDTNKHE